MSMWTARWAIVLAALAALGASPTARAQDPAVEPSPADTTRIEAPVNPADSVRVKTEEKVAEVLKWLRETRADTVDTAQSQPAPVRPPVLAPQGETGKRVFLFPKVAASPHTAFSDHLLEDGEFDAVGTTEYATERMFTCRGLNPLAVQVDLDGIPLDLRRLTFPQTMAPDLMTAPPYLFSSFTLAPSAAGGHVGESIVLSTTDSMSTLPVSDFLVRRGDYGLSLTQGRLFRPLPGRRMINLGFSFAQSDGRGLYNRGDNRYLHGRFVTPVLRGYNVLLDVYQYRAQSDIQTALDWWRYNFRRDDLAWHAGALLFRGDSVHSPFLVQATVRGNKQDLHSQPQTYHALMKTSHAELSAVYAPLPADSGREWRAGGTVALDQLHVGSAHFRRPEYALWGERLWRSAAHRTLHAAARIDGNDHDPPGPQFAVDWSVDTARTWRMAVGIQRSRIMPSQADRRWPLYAATLEDVEDRMFSYSEEGARALTTWWSTGIDCELGYRTPRGIAVSLRGWGSYEQDAYYWRNVANSDTIMMTYRPSTTDARTAGLVLHADFPALGPFSSHAGYVYTRAEDESGKRLPDYADHRLTGIVDAELNVPRLNLNLHGSVEFMYRRAPGREYTAYNRREVFRTDVLGSATIKDFTIYWLAQNLFNYGYRKEPQFTYTGRTIMWGLHLRFFN